MPKKPPAQSPDPRKIASAREAVNAYKSEGTYAAAGEILGVSRQRVAFLVQFAREYNLRGAPDRLTPKNVIERNRGYREANIKNGMCPYHATRKPAPGRVRCEKCLADARAYVAKKKRPKRTSS
ncbi:MAG: hypothetical protein NVSMB31_14460 [Vulcanimicrobiaceae bacterium]